MIARVMLLAVSAVIYALSFTAATVARGASTAATWVVATVELGWSDAWPAAPPPDGPAAGPPHHVRRG